MIIDRNKAIKYKDFCKTKLAKETALTPDEIKYYNCLNKFINEHCIDCKNKNIDKCNITENIKGILQCTEEKK